MNRMIKFSVGICAFNEEKAIKHLLSFLLKEKFKQCQMQQIVVVASGCTDKTEDVVMHFSKIDSRVKLITEKERKGKSSAVNLILKENNNKFIILISADVMPAKGAIEKLILAIQESEVGMAAGRIIPRNVKNNLVGYAVNLEWRLHHLVALNTPKAGEMIAFRPIFKRIHPASAVDEVILECLILTQGYQIRYIPEAIIYNKGPETIRDFLRQRRRIYSGEVATKVQYGYTVPTFKIRGLLPYITDIFEPNWQFFIYTPIVVGMEIIARTFGWFDYHFKVRSHTVWNMVKSSRK